MAIDKTKYDAAIIAAADRYRNNPRVLKAIVQVESSYNPRAYRFEPEFFKRLKVEDPWWADKDPSIVSASYGLAQVLFTTAWALDRPSLWKTMNHQQFQHFAERLYDPETNLNYASLLLRRLLDKVKSEAASWGWDHLSFMDIALARYNGGSKKNPDEYGELRNAKYVDKAWRAYDEIPPIGRKS